MAVYVVTGKLGSGKTLVSVGKIKDKLVRGCKVATNLDIKLDKLIGPTKKQTRFYRIPDKPQLADLEAIGTGTDSYDESKNGLLVLDECGTWFNSRSWADKERQAVINWFLHARKLGWDIIFLIQDLSIIDKQARVALAEHVVYCRRMDRLTLPFIGALWSMFAGGKFPMPKVHLGIVKYGDSQSAIVVERWTYTGRSLYSSYDTKQSFSDHYPHGTYSVLPPWYTHGFKMVPRDGYFAMRMTRIYWKRFNRPLVGIAGLVLGSVLSLQLFAGDPVESSPGPDRESVDLSPYENYWIVGYSRLGDAITYRLDDGKKTTNTDELRRQGLKITPVDNCRVRLSQGESYAMLTC